MTARIALTSRSALALLLLALPIAASCTGADDASFATPRAEVQSLFAGTPEAARTLAEDLALDWLDEVDDAVLRDVDTVDTRRVQLDQLGRAHVRLDQFEKGVPVFGGQVIVHLTAEGKIQAVTDSLVRNVRIDSTPLFTADDAVATAIDFHAGDVDSAEPDLQALRHDGSDHLTWRVRIHNMEPVGPALPSMPVVFVDAHSGEVVWSYDNLQSARNRNTYDGNNSTQLPGSLARIEGQGSVGDVPVDDAHDHAGITYDYYFNEQGRDSYNDNGATMVSTAHYGNNVDNAYWNGSQMLYGDGNIYFTPLSGALDVVAHELTHAVTEYTANLIYSGESGGLNEAMSDIIGVTVESWSQGWLIDSDTWKLGEDIATPALGDALRYIDNPPADGVSIDNYSNYYNGMDVHYSSGIANKAFYLMVQDPAMSMEEAADVFYRALTIYMTPSTNFAEARTACENAATDLFGSGSGELAAVQSAWTAVGVSPSLNYVVYDTQSGLSASSGNQTFYQYATVTNAQGMRFAISGGSGDADLYVKFGSAPTTSSYDCRPYLNGNNETCTFAPPQVGTYHVMIRAYSSYSGVTLNASHAGGNLGDPEVCDDAIDNDLDGDVDCADSDCATDPACGSPEVCDDGIDNDFDGDTDCADSDCATDPACGSPEVCDDGIDNDFDGDTDCADSDCATDPVCPQPEVCDDGIDNDFDGDTDCADSDCATDPVCPQPEVCDDGVDNDFDGDTDCADSDCATDPACGSPEVCDDAIDNDFDGFTDCADPDCSTDPACATPEVCDDGVDNDLDGLTDCDDPDCGGDPACPVPEVCDDGIDNDFDGDTDCADADCSGDPACPEPEVCDDGFDNDFDGFTDCADADCDGDPACPEPEVCDDGIDNDFDGFTDCADADCDGDPACPEPEVCDDGVDNDFDGDTDCDDADCASDPVCNPVACPGGEYTGTLSSSNKNDYVTYSQSQAGLFEAALSGPSNTNFDLYLQHWNGNRWRNRATSRSSNSEEFISYIENSSRPHRWRIRRRQGNGSYSLCVESPPE